MQSHYVDPSNHRKTAAYYRLLGFLECCVQMLQTSGTSANTQDKPELKKETKSDTYNSTKVSTNIDGIYNHVDLDMGGITILIPKKPALHEC
ncbi:hypothetical protein BIY23_03265 [Wolbachia pipientis]|uniref:Uncharacterized protein n=1 Tax=Wolbachia pipientis TaxID=955 RepID=A0A1E7QJJ9_WOLPI|nr:hypothetical protein [Wolbachia pipientis]OEY86557.1 hypothetical protein BIY23_03265 [Wolbachia pipientis]